MKFILEHWQAIGSALMPIAWSIVRLTPSKKDDVILKLIVKLIEIVPDKKKGGGLFKRKKAVEDKEPVPKMK